ncbi:hypothetical protein BKA81DRAFT_125922 [Phyllosticta paracitricarpa]
MLSQGTPPRSSTNQPRENGQHLSKKVAESAETTVSAVSRFCKTVRYVPPEPRCQSKPSNKSPCPLLFGSSHRLLPPAFSLLQTCMWYENWHAFICSDNLPSSLSPPTSFYWPLLLRSIFTSVCTVCAGLTHQIFVGFFVAASHVGHLHSLSNTVQSHVTGIGAKCHSGCILQKEKMTWYRRAPCLHLVG